MRRFLASVTVGALALGLLSGLAHADSAVTVSDARLRLMPGDLPGAGYLRIHNGRDTTITLVAAHCKAYSKVTMHKSVTKNGMANMEAIQSIAIGPGQDFEFAPGGYHLMLMQRSAPLKVGDTVTIILELAGGDSEPVVFNVVSPAAM